MTSTEFHNLIPTPDLAVWEAARWVAYCIDQGLLPGDNPAGGAA